MTETIRTQYWSNNNGAGRIKVTYRGKSKSVPFDHAARDADLSAIARVLPGVSVDENYTSGRVPEVKIWTVTA